MRNLIDIITEAERHPLYDEFGTGEEWRKELPEIKARAKAQHVEIELEGGIDSINLVDINSRFSRGAKKGAAAEIIWELCRLADANNLMIHLAVAGGMKGLVRYYERFDFEMDHNYAEEPHEDEDEDSYGEELTMTREPRVIMAEDVAKRRIVPDIGTIIEIDDPTQFNNRNGLVAGKRTHVVKSWMKAAPEPKFDLDNEEDFDHWIDHVVAGARDGLGDIVASSARRFNDNKRLMWCTREEAEYLACGGRIIPVGTGVVKGRVAWPPEQYASVRASALRKVGEMLF